MYSNSLIFDPKINFRAKSFHKMVNLSHPDIHEPPSDKAVQL